MGNYAGTAALLTAFDMQLDSGQPPPLQQFADRHGLAQHRAEPGQGIVDRLGVPAGAAKALQCLGRHEFDQQVGGARRHPDKMHHQHAVVLQ